MYGQPSGFPIAAQPTPISLAGKTVIVIGGTAGLGFALAKASKAAGMFTLKFADHQPHLPPHFTPPLFPPGATVTIVGRTQKPGSDGLTFVPCDVSLMSNVRRLAEELPVEAADVLAFTSGIIPKKQKVVTAEGVEEDMAVSALSRHVFLAAAAPRLKAGARVFIWGMPGNGVVKDANAADLNSDAAYGGSFTPPTHANTIALNEALVAHWAAKGVATAGFNPGLVATGIRDVMHGGTGCLARCFESCIGCFNPSPDSYAAALLPLLTAPELIATKGLLFGQHGAAIKGSPELASADDVKKWIDAADALAAKAAGATGADKVTLRSV